MALTCPFCTDKKGRVKLKLSKKYKPNNELGTWYFCPCCHKKFHIKSKRNGKKKVILHHPEDKRDRGKVIDHRLLEA